MGEPHVISALVRKRGQLAGEIEAARSRLQSLISDLESLDSTILLFDPDYCVVGIKPIAFRMQETKSPKGEMTRSILDLLRQSSRPMTAPEVVRAVMTAKGLDCDDVRAVRHMTGKVNVALRAQRKKGVVRSSEGPDVHLVWSVEVSDRRNP